MPTEIQDLDRAVNEDVDPGLQDSTDAPPDPVQTEPAVSPQGPIGQGEHKVREGECVTSIAFEAGLPEERVWDDPANAAVKTARVDRNILLDGDRLHVPEIARREEPGATEMRHRFELKIPPVLLRLRMLDEDEPRANEPYCLKIDGRVLQGTTDAAGCLQVEIPPQAKRAVLRMGDIQSGEDYVLQIGALDPLDQISGIQSRLLNLGFDPGPIDGVLGPKTERALTAFQRKHDLEPTGRPDSPTQQKLKEQYGC